MEIISALKCEAIYHNTFICGVGAKRLPRFTDHIVNIGICAGENIGQIYEVNRINKKYYPDCFSNLKKMPITTVDKLQTNINPGMLYDMEAAVIYEAAQKYLGPHQIHFLKIVSDRGQEVNNKDYIQSLVRKHKSTIDKYIECLPKIKAYHLSTDIKLSSTMEKRLQQQYKYSKIIGVDITCFLKPGLNKQQTIKMLDEIDKFLMERS